MKPPMSSRVPEAVDALVELAQAMKADGVVDDVFDGPTPMGATKNHTAIAVFVTPEAAVVEQQPMSGWGTVYQEAFDVVCNIISWSGGDAVRPHREACLEILDDLKTRLTADPQLGGVCDRAYLGRRARWIPVNDDNGASVEVAFTVRVEATV